MILLFLNECVLFNSKFYGNDAEPFANMSRGLWELCENSQLECEDLFKAFTMAELLLL